MNHRWLVSWTPKKNWYVTIQYFIKKCMNFIFYENTLQTFAWAKHQCKELNMINEILLSMVLHSISDGYHILCCVYAERAKSNFFKEAISMHIWATVGREVWHSGCFFLFVIPFMRTTVYLALFLAIHQYLIFICIIFTSKVVFHFCRESVYFLLPSI